LLALGLLHALTYWYVTSDDALITLRYSWNLAHGYGAVYNPGAEPVEGYSNPLFMAAVAALIAVGLHPVLAIKLLGLSAFLATIALLPRIVDALQGGARARDDARPVAALLMAASAFPAFWATAGLETQVHALLIALAVWATMTATARGDVGLAPLPWVAVAASRPEGAFVGAFAFAAHWALLRFRPTVMWRWFLLFGLPVLALLALRYGYYGSLTPNTYQAKAFFSEKTLALGLAQLREFAVGGGAWVLVPAAAGALLGVFVAELRPALIAASAALAQLCFTVLVGGDFMPAFRFLMPAYPLLCALAAPAIARAARRWAAGHGATATALATAVLALGICWQQTASIRAHPLRFWLQHDRPWFDYVGRTDFDGTWLEAHESAGRYVREHARAGDRLAVTEAGAIPYFAGVHTLDMLGLNDRFVAGMWRKAREEHAADAQTAAGSSGQNEPGQVRYRVYDVVSYVLAQNPRWIIIDGSFVGERSVFVPRLPVARALVENLQFSRYASVHQATVYRAEDIGVGADRVDVVFERRDRKRRAR
jgi:hypothetical protein